MNSFVERLWPSVSWWLIVGLLAIGVGLVFIPVLDLRWVLAAMVLTVGLAAWALVSFAAVISVDDDGLHAGRALLPWDAVGAVTVLDADEARAVRGPRADPSAYLLLRAYVPAGIIVRVNDAADPTPYWYLSTRRPAALAAALVNGPSAGASGTVDPG